MGKIHENLVINPEARGFPGSNGAIHRAGGNAVAKLIRELRVSRSFLGSPQESDGIPPLLSAGVIPHIHKSLIGKKGQQKTA